MLANSQNKKFVHPIYLLPQSWHFPSCEKFQVTKFYKKFKAGYTSQSLLKFQSTFVVFTKNLKKSQVVPRLVEFENNKQQVELQQLTFNLLYKYCIINKNLNKF